MSDDLFAEPTEVLENVGHDETAERYLLGAALLFEHEHVRGFARGRIARLGVDAFAPGERRALAQLVIAGASPRDVRTRLELRHEMQAAQDAYAGRVYLAITDAVADVASAATRRALLREACALATLATSGTRDDLREAMRSRRAASTEVRRAA